MLILVGVRLVWILCLVLLCDGDGRAARFELYDLGHIKLVGFVREGEIEYVCDIVLQDPPQVLRID